MAKLIEIAALDITIYKFVLPLMDRLKADSFKALVATNDSGYSGKLAQHGYDVHRIDFVRNLSPIKNLKALLQLIKLFKEERPDVIHVHTPIASVLSRIAIKLVSRSTIVVYTLHGLNKSPVFLFAEYLACRYMTDYIFTVNRDDRNYLVAHKFIAKNKITCLNSVGINTDRFSPKNVTDKEIEKLKDTLKIKPKPVLGFVGRPVDIKGFSEIVDAFIQVRKKIDCQLLIVGDIYLSERDTKTLTNAKKKIKSNGFKKDVIFTGQRDDIPQMLSLIDIFVHPSKWEGMCISVLEAMSMELPVIGTDIRGIREEITNKTGILVPVGDSCAIAEAMETLLKDTEKRIAMGKNGRKRVIKHFNEKTVVETQVKVFNKKRRSNF